MQSLVDVGERCQGNHWIKGTYPDCKEGLICEVDQDIGYCIKSPEGVAHEGEECGNIGENWSWKGKPHCV